MVPDSVIRHGIRRLLKRRLSEIGPDDCERVARDQAQFIRMMDDAEIAPLPDRANEQHYEVPPEFFVAVLGHYKKYSCCYWTDEAASLDAAEVAALRLTADRARITDGMDILDLGCGWGSFSLWAAESFPASAVVAVSNSQAQRTFIEAEANRRGITNLEIITRDMNEFDAGRQFDRVVSIEMFEHMRNYRALFQRVSSWLKPDGMFFMHIFCHRAAPYEFVDAGPSDWMARHFFSGGIMPSDDLPLHFQQHLGLVERWRVDGRHYEKTANAWLENMDRHKGLLMPILEETYGRETAELWRMRWRIFFMACAELFGYAQGQEWWVGHYLFRRTATG